MIEHQSTILKRDLALGTFLTQLEMPFNRVLYSVFAAYFAYTNWRPITDTIGNSEIIFFIFLFIFFLALIIGFVALYSALFATFGSQFKKGVLGVHEFQFDEKEFSETTDFNSTTMKYSSVTGIVTRFDSIYIQLPGWQWHVLPKRGFQEDKDRLALLDFLHERCDA